MLYSAEIESFDGRFGEHSTVLVGDILVSPSTLYPRGLEDMQVRGYQERFASQSK
jgi:hypothetical protein